MKNSKEALKILRLAGEKEDDQLNIAETALAMASLEKAGASMVAFRAHLDLLTQQIRAEGTIDRLGEQLRCLRNLLVVQHKYQGDEKHSDDSRITNLMDVIDRKRGSGVLLGILYLHVAHAAGWAMTGVDLSGHFLLRLSARDGQALIDPFRAGQTCRIEEVEDAFYSEEAFTEEHFFADEEAFDLTSALVRPLTRREVLLRLQHNVKCRLLAQDRVEPAIATLQSMLLFAPKQQDLWREVGYLQAERGHIRAAITALEVVQELAPEHVPPNQTEGILRELRWRLN